MNREERLAEEYARNPCCTVCGDGLFGLANAYMQIKTGHIDVVAVEAHSKISDLLTFGDIMLFAFDPRFERPASGPVERPKYGGSPEYTSEAPKPLIGRSDEKERIHPYFIKPFRPFKLICMFNKNIHCSRLFSRSKIIPIKLSEYPYKLFPFILFPNFFH